MSKRITQAERCTKQVFGDYHAHQCTRRGVVEEDGRLWCRQHQPTAAAAKKAETARKWREEYTQSQRLHDTKDALIRSVLSIGLHRLPEPILRTRMAYEEARK